MGQPTTGVRGLVRYGLVPLVPALGIRCLSDQKDPFPKVRGKSIRGQSVSRRMSGNHFILTNLVQNIRLYIYIGMEKNEKIIRFFSSPK